MSAIAVLIGLSVYPARAMGIDLQAAPGIQDPLQADRAAPPGSTELPELRTSDTATYVTDDDQYVTRFYEGSVNYRDPSGKWKRIENELVPTLTPGFAYKNAANRYVAEFPSDVADPVRFTFGGESVSLTLEGADASLSADGDTARYQGVMPGVSAEYQPLNDALKESLILSSPDVPASFPFFLKTSDGLSAEKSKAGGVDFVAGGEVKFSLAAPSMHDSGTPAAFSQGVELTLEKVAGGYMITLVPDRAWLESKRRVWPVILDPSLFLRSDKECTIFARGDAWETDRRCRDPNYSTVTIGADNAGSPQQARSLFKFNLDQIPADANVVSANLGLNLLYAQLPGQEIQLHRVTRDWTNRLNWRTHNGVDSWTSAGGDFYPSSADQAMTPAPGGWVLWGSQTTFKALVQGWVDRTIPNYGVLVRTTNESGTMGNLHYFWSSSSYLSQYWPYLDVKWKPQGRYTSASANSWTVDGGTGSTPKVEAIESRDDKLYIGGDFSAVGPRTGSFVTFGTTDRAFQPNVAEVAGNVGAPSASSVPVRAVASDGGGGWYIGGDFRYVGGRDVNRLAHIRANGTLDETWRPEPDGPVYALARSGSALYVGGDFTRIGGQSRRGLALLNGANGAVDASFDAGANGAVRAIALAGTGTIYIGGDFTSMGNGDYPRVRLAGLASGGLPTSLNRPVNDTVNALAVSGSDLYVGGRFTTVDGVARERLARISTIDNSLRPWRPEANGEVDSLLLDGTAVYVGGNFSRVSRSGLWSADRDGLAAIGTGGDLLQWDPNSGAAGAGTRVRALALQGPTLFVGGEFSTMGGQQRANLAALSIDSASATTWDPEAGSTVHALAMCGGASCYGGSDRVAAGGRFRSANVKERKNLAALNAATGEPTDWNPSPNGRVNALELARGALYVGGEYTMFEKGGPGESSATRKGLAYFIDKTAKPELAPWTPEPCGSASTANVTSLSASPSTLYVGAPCFSFRGVERRGIVAFSLDSAEMKTAFNPEPKLNGENAVVKEIETDGEYVFFAGEFSTVLGNDGQNHARARLASYSENGTLTGWMPNPDAEVSDLAVANGKVYVGGDFNQLGPYSCPKLGSFSTANGGGPLLSWGGYLLPCPFVDGRVDAIDADGTGVYIGGRFSQVNFTRRDGIAALHPETRVLLPLAPAVNAEQVTQGSGSIGLGLVRVMDITDERLNVGGDWYALGSKAQTGLASFPSYGYMAEPREGERTRKRLTLRAATQVSMFNSVRFEFRPPTAAGQPSASWREIPIGNVRDASNQAISSWPLSVSNGTSPVIAWNMPGTAGVDRVNGKYEVRAVFSEPNGEQYPTEAVVATLDQDAPAPDDAVEAIGPGKLDLLTGNFSLAYDDVKESGFNSDLTFTRSYNSRRPAAGSANSPLGPQWTTSLPVDAGFSDYARVEVESYTFEEERMDFATVYTSDGSAFYFLYANGEFKPEAGSEDLTLTRLGSGGLRIKDLENNETLLRQDGATTCSDEGYVHCVERYVPSEVRQPGDDTKTTFDYDVVGDGKLRIKRIYAPGAQRWLEFAYSALTSMSANGFGEFAGRLHLITLNTAGTSDIVFSYAYDSEGRLRQAADHRGFDLGQPNSFLLIEEYNYDSEGHLTYLKPPGTNAWTISYAAIPSDPAIPGNPAPTGRLRSVSRAQPGGSSAQTTVLYDVPTVGAYAPYMMSASQVASWGQQAVPTDVTAIFPPTHVPNAPAGQQLTLPQSEYFWATIHYMDRKGREINVSSPGGGPDGHISTTEYDEHNNVVRQLTPANRLAALGAGTGSAAMAAQLDTQQEFSPDGIELLHEWGPLHRIQLADGTLVDARQHTAYSYDGFSELEFGTPPAHLVDTVTVGARVPGEEDDRDVRRTDFDYFDDGAEQGIKLRKPTTITVDPGPNPKLNLRTRVRYNADGLEISRSTPGAPVAPDPRTTRTIYYTAGTNPDDSECGNRLEWKNLPCKVLPEAQPSTTGPPNPPKLPETKLDYNRFYHVTIKTETVRQSSSPSKTRTTSTVYDKAGRIKRQNVTKDPELPAERISEVVNSYDSNTGQLATTTFAGGGPTITREYDALGRVHKYRDGDLSQDSLTTTTYDLAGRVTSVVGPKGSQTYQYYDEPEEPSGRRRSVTDSAAGVFAATAYNANGQLLEQMYPNGLKATTTYDATGTATHLKYQKGTNVWLEFNVTESIHGQWMRHRSTLSDQDFTYDQAGRLIETKDMPHPGGDCAKRKYSYDSESNRTSMVAFAGVGSTCTSSGSTTTNYSYDSANRLTGSGVEYDDFGRTTRLPASYADRGTNPQPLTTSYYVNDLVRVQTQGAVSNEYELDPMRRQRTRKESQSGALSATETYHYGDDSDSPEWIERVPMSGDPSWSRMIEGVGGGLVGIQSSDGTTKLQLTNLHGDVVATCSADAGASSYTRTGEADEFGMPRQDDSPKYSWLGGKQRRTELKSGVVQMGVRSYVPNLGRFLQVDPVSGGSANAYDYAAGDPVNNLDLDGQKCTVVSGHKRKLQRRGGHKIYVRFGLQCSSKKEGWTAWISIHKKVAVQQYGSPPKPQPPAPKCSEDPGGIFSPAPPCHEHIRDARARPPVTGKGSRYIRLRDDDLCDPGYRYFGRIVWEDASGRRRRVETHDITC